MINAATPGDVRYIQYNRHYIEYITGSLEAVQGISAAAAGAGSLEAVQGISAAAPAAAGPRAGGCAWGWARVLVRVLVERGDPC